jgi:hypothetical protein
VNRGEWIASKVPRFNEDRGEEVQGSRCKEAGGGKTFVEFVDVHSC